MCGDGGGGAARPWGVGCNELRCGNKKCRPHLRLPNSTMKPT